MNLLFFLFLIFQTCFPSAITFELNGGRFGDCLSCYTKAKYFSCVHKLPLYYTRFTYSDQLTLHAYEAEYTKDSAAQFDAIIRVNSDADIKNNKDKNVLFVSHFYSQTPGLYEYGFQDKVFATELKKMLTPLAPMPLIEKKEGTISVAVHVRKGGGFDKPLSSSQIYKKYQYADQQWPTKFPPDQFYLDQIMTLKKLVGSDILIIYLFTDDPNPAALAERYQRYLDDPTIQFVYRENNSHDTKIVEDFYIMSQCDCLIRSTSLFAKAAQLLGNHTIIMYPIVGTWDKDKVIINPAGIIIRD